MGLVVPVAYLAILIGSLATFSSLYRKRKAGKHAEKTERHLLIEADTPTARSTSLEPWFGPHVQRNIYLSLLHLEPQPGQGKATPVPESIIKAALLQRACEDIKRILAIRSAKQPLSQLLQRGSVGDELWQRLLRAEKEIEAELKDVVEEVRKSAAIPTLSLMNLCRRMLSHQTGDNPSFKAQTKWSIMQLCARRSPSYRRRAK